jgi:hypothetical protein
MLPIVLLIVILLFPVCSDAAYKVYLKNGSVLSGVSSYEKNNGEVTIYFGGGSMGIPEKDILKIQESEAPEKDFRIGGTAETPVRQDEATPVAAEPVSDKSSRVNALRTELENVNSDIQTTEQEEARIVQAINDRKGSRLTYNSLQLRKLDSDLAPLQQELSDIQVKKGGLLQRRSLIESELRTLE